MYKDAATTPAPSTDLAPPRGVRKVKARKQTPRDVVQGEVLGVRSCRLLLQTRKDLLAACRELSHPDASGAGPPHAHRSDAESFRRSPQDGQV